MGLAGGLRVLVLGPLTVEVEGRVLHVAGSHRRRLLAFLATRPGRNVSVDTIVEAVWGEEPPPSAKKTLQTHVVRLRRSLAEVGGQVIETVPGGYRLSAEPSAVDAVRFEQLAADGSRALARGDEGTARTLLVDALGLWRGSAFAEFADEPWARGVVTRLEGLRRAATDDLAEALIRLGRVAEAVTLLESQVVLQEYRERPVGLLMRALAMDGRVAEALRAFQRFRTQLREEIGIEPTAQLRAVETELLRGRDGERDVVRPATANVLVTDTVGSTRFLVRAGAEAAEAYRRRHDGLVAAVVEVFGGEVVKSTGDGVLAVLPSADFLVRAGGAVQEAAAARGMRLRVAVSTGDVIREAGDCFGEAPVVAFRLCDRCPEGSVLVDAATVAVRGRRRDPPVRRFETLLLRGFDDPHDVWIVDLPPEPVTAAGATGEATADRVYGRRDESALIESAWDASNTTLIVVGGEPGIGKTHLARAIAHRCDRVEPMWVRFAATAADGFTAWCAALDGYAAGVPTGVIAALGPSVVARIAALVPSVAARLPVNPVPVSGDADRNVTFDALAALVEIVGRDRMIVLDDAHWAGGTSDAFLTHLKATTSGLRVVATSRLPVPDALQAVADLTVPLAGMAEQDLRDMLHARGVGGAVAEDAVRRATGNPLLALVAAEGSSVDGDPVAASFLAMPGDQLEVLGVAALVGRTVDVALLSELTEIRPSELSGHLDASVRAGLLAGGETLAFVHDLVRETAAASIPAHRRVVLHAAVAAALQRRGDAVGAIDHVLQGFGAVDPLAAIGAVDRGCDLLAQRVAYEEMLSIATRLVEIVSADPRCGPQHEAWALLEASWAYQGLGNMERHKEFALLAGHKAIESGDYEVLAEAALTRAGYGLAGIIDTDTAALIDAALARVPSDDAASCARLLAMRAFYLFNYEGRGEEARAMSLEAVALARSAADDRAVRDALSCRLYVLLAGSDVLGQLGYIDELRTLATRLPPLPASVARFPRTELQRRFLSVILRNLVVLRLQLADRGGFEAAVTEMETSAKRRRLEGGLVTMWKGLEALLDGDPDTAERQAGALLARNPDHNLVASAAGLLAAAHRWRGTLPAIAAEINRFAATSPGLPIAASLAAVSSALTGDLTGAATRLDELLNRSPLLVDDSTLSAQLAVITEACALVGRDVPDAVVARLEPFTGQLLVMSWGIEVVGAADRFLAIAAAINGDRSAAAAGFERAAELEARISSVLPLRTLLWRHVLVGDVPEPACPPALGGLAAEARALRHVRG
jgi:DNA-binding SARP family transcriptional activator